MKKRSYLALMLSIVMVLSLLTGCGSKEPEMSTITPVVEAPTQAPTEAPTETPTEAPTEEPAEVPEQEETVSLGRMEGGVYTNAYTGYGCTLDSNWQFYTAEELQELPSAEELFADSDISDVVAKYPQINDMMAENVAELASINVLYTQISLQERLTYATMTSEEVVDLVLSQMDLIVNSYAQSGIQVKSAEKVFVTFLGEECAAIKTLASIDDVEFYMLQIQDYNLGAYGATLTITTYLEDNTQSVLDLFYPVA